MRWPDFGLVHILRALLNLTPVRSFVKRANTSCVPRWVIFLTAVACAVTLLAEVRPMNRAIVHRGGIFSFLFSFVAELWLAAHPLAQRVCLSRPSTTVS